MLPPCQQASVLPVAAALLGGGTDVLYLQESPGLAGQTEQIHVYVHVRTK